MAATVFSKKVNGAATHALVIGVSHYPHLPGGASHQKVANPDGMEQLASPAKSARAVAQWLIEQYHCPKRPLASVSLLTSEKAPVKFEAKPQGNGKKISVVPAVATMAAVKEAILGWHELGNANPDHLLLFYFCGHGISAGVEQALLMADFGEQPHAPLAGALDFRRFHLNMDECAARNQCYFIDACRIGSALLKGNQGFSGDPVLQWVGAAPNPNGQMRLGPILFATLADAGAYARAGKVSLYTEALLDCLSGAGSGDEEGAWEVQVSVLQRALTRLMREASDALGMPLAQIPQGYIPGEITLNTLAEPIVPVFLRVDPPEAQALAVLRYESDKKKDKRAPSPETWRVTVPTGKYSFFADFKKDFKDAQLLDELVRPPFWVKPLKAAK